MFRCKSNECEGHEGICCLSCKDIMLCSAPCESMNTDDNSCEDKQLITE